MTGKRGAWNAIQPEMNGIDSLAAELDYTPFSGPVGVDDFHEMKMYEPEKLWGIGQVIALHGITQIERPLCVMIQWSGVKAGTIKWALSIPNN